MPLTQGDKLGLYEILALIGKGGMGEVYRAHDDRLRRDVAIKISKDQFTERFTREARAVASLNHTNICHLYDVVIEKDAPNYLVMECVEGEDIKGPLSFDEALPIIRQLIDGIEAAPEGLGTVSGYPLLFAELIRRGWSDENLAKLAGGNLLRVLRRAEAVAASMKNEPPATATLKPWSSTDPWK